MTDRALDAPLLERTDDALARPLPEALTRARIDAAAAVADLLAIPEAALTKPWDWIGGSEEEVRYGAYRAAETLELAEIEARTILAPTRSGETRAALLIGPATAARWDLQGLLAPLVDADLDADPGNDEWPIRTVVGHTIVGQRAYGWGSAWWITNPHVVGDPALPASVPDEFWETLPDDAEGAPGPIADIRAAFDAALDLAAERLAGIADDRLELAARWSGYAVTVGFRFGRWSSHIREHAIQVEKTLVMLGRTPTEPERLARHVLAAYGRAEAAVFARRPGSETDAAARRIAAGAAEAREAVSAIRKASGA